MTGIALGTTRLMAGVLPAGVREMT